MGRGDQRHALQHFQAALCLPGFRGLVTESIHITLDVFNLFLLAREHRLLLRQRLSAARFKLTIVAGVQADLLMFDVGDAGTDLVQKIPVMGDHQQNARITSSASVPARE